MQGFRRLAPPVLAPPAMRFLALASDYDGTLANGHTVSPRVIGALERLTASGRRLILVTGREVEDLVHVFPEVELFDHVVAENGAVLFRPGLGRRERAGRAAAARFPA